MECPAPPSAFHYVDFSPISDDGDPTSVPPAPPSSQFPSSSSSPPSSLFVSAPLPSFLPTFSSSSSSSFVLAQPHPPPVTASSSSSLLQPGEGRNFSVKNPASAAVFASNATDAFLSPLSSSSHLHPLPSSSSSLGFVAPAVPLFPGRACPPLVGGGDSSSPAAPLSSFSSSSSALLPPSTASPAFAFPNPVDLSSFLPYPPPSSSLLPSTSSSSPAYLGTGRETPGSLSGVHTLQQQPPSSGVQTLSSSLPGTSGHPQHRDLYQDVSRPDLSSSSSQQAPVEGGGGPAPPRAALAEPRRPPGGSSSSASSSSLSPSSASFSQPSAAFSSLQSSPPPLLHPPHLGPSPPSQPQSRQGSRTNHTAGEEGVGSFRLQERTPARSQPASAFPPKDLSPDSGSAGSSASGSGRHHHHPQQPQAPSSSSSSSSTAGFSSSFSSSSSGDRERESGAGSDFLSDFSQAANEEETSEEIFPEKSIRHLLRRLDTRQASIEMLSSFVQPYLVSGAERLLSIFTDELGRFSSSPVTRLGIFYAFHHLLHQPAAAPTPIHHPHLHGKAHLLNPALPHLSSSSSSLHPLQALHAALPAADAPRGGGGGGEDSAGGVAQRTSGHAHDFPHAIEGEEEGGPSQGLRRFLPPRNSARFGDLGYYSFLIPLMKILHVFPPPLLEKIFRCCCIFVERALYTHEAVRHLLSYGSPGVSSSSSSAPLLLPSSSSLLDIHPLLPGLLAESRVLRALQSRGQELHLPAFCQACNQLLNFFPLRSLLRTPSVTKATAYARSKLSELPFESTAAASSSAPPPPSSSSSSSFREHIASLLLPVPGHSSLSAPPPELSVNLFMGGGAGAMPFSTLTECSAVLDRATRLSGQEYILLQSSLLDVTAALQCLHESFLSLSESISSISSSLLSPSSSSSSTSSSSSLLSRKPQSSSPTADSTAPSKKRPLHQEDGVSGSSSSVLLSLSSSSLSTSSSPSSSTKGQELSLLNPPAHHPALQQFGHAQNQLPPVLLLQSNSPEDPRADPQQKALSAEESKTTAPSVMDTSPEEAEEERGGQEEEERGAGGGEEEEEGGRGEESRRGGEEEEERTERGGEEERRGRGGGEEEEAVSSEKVVVTRGEEEGGEGDGAGEQRGEEREEEEREREEEEEQREEEEEEERRGDESVGEEDQIRQKEEE